MGLKPLGNEDSPEFRIGMTRSHVSTGLSSSLSLYGLKNMSVGCGAEVEGCGPEQEEGYINGTMPLTGDGCATSARRRILGSRQGKLYQGGDQHEKKAM